MEYLLKQNERKSLRDTFKTHPLLSTCNKVFMPRMARLNSLQATPEDVFCETAWLLDFLMCKPEVSQQQVDSLWNLLLLDIRKWKADATEHDKLMVAGTVFMVVRSTLTQHAESLYRETISDLLNCTLERELSGCDEQEQMDFHKRLIQRSPDLCEWINHYDEADDWLSDQIADIVTAVSTSGRKTTTAKSKKKRDLKSNVKPKTLKYYSHGNNGVLAKQHKRVDIVFSKWNDWKWIGANSAADNFDKLFEGKDQHCNIDWKANTTILTILLRDLLAYKDCHGDKIIEGQTGQFATSMVRKQFGKTPNSDEKRLTDTDKFRIKATIYLLDINNPLPLREGGGDHDYDSSDVALQEVMSGQLRQTKGI